MGQRKKEQAGQVESRGFANITTTFLALLMSVFLLAIPPSGYTNIIAFKYTLFLIICGGYVLAILLLRLELALVGHMPFQKPLAVWKSLHIVQKLLLIYLALSALATLFSKYDGAITGAQRHEGILTIAIYVFLCLFVSKYFKPHRWLLYVFGGAILLFCALCIVQLAGGNPFGLYPGGFNYFDAGERYSGEYLGTIGNTGLCAALLCLAAGIFAMTLIRLEGKGKWAFVVPLFITVFTLLETDVEAGQVALMAGFVLMLPVAASDGPRLKNTLTVFGIVLLTVVLSRAIAITENGFDFQQTNLLPAGIAIAAALFLGAVFLQMSKRQRHLSAPLIRKGAFAFVALLILSGGAYLWFYSGAKTGFLFEASELLHGQAEDGFGSNRLYIWRNIIENMNVRILLIGSGPDTVGLWPIEPFQRYSELLGTWLTTTIDVAHNEYLNLVACQGIFSLFSYIGALFISFWKWYNNTISNLSAIAGAGVLFYCIQAFFGISMFVQAPFFWCTLAILIYAHTRVPAGIA